MASHLASNDTGPSAGPNTSELVTMMIQMQMQQNRYATNQQKIMEKLGIGGSFPEQTPNPRTVPIRVKLKKLQHIMRTDDALAWITADFSADSAGLDADGATTVVS